MKLNGCRVFLAGLVLAFWSACGYGAEVQGYRVVLASFPTFEEARSNLERLGGALGDEEKSLQSRYGYEIVARPSGRAFIVGIEPIGTDGDRDRVLKRFQRFYPDAYGDKYHGPTEGAVVWNPSGASKVAEEEEGVAAVPEGSMVAEAVGKSDEGESETVGAADQTTLPAVPEEAEAEEKEPSPHAESYFGLFEGKIEWFWAIAAITLLFIGSVVWIRSLKWNTDETHDSHDKQEVPADTEEEPGELDISVNEADESADEERGEEPVAQAPEEEETDIFFRLKKNMFFMTALAQLKDAAEAQDAQKCGVLMEEILRYQNNFRESAIMAQMEELINAREFTRLFELLKHENA